MKRIFAFVLCWTMLLSQMVMIADALHAKEQSDILYLEENGIVVEEGGEVLLQRSPLGRSDTTERYSPSVPKFTPQALQNLGLAEPEKEQRNEMPQVMQESNQGTGPEVPTYRATIKSNKFMMYAFPRSDAESVYLKGCAGKEVELIRTDSVMWYYMIDINDACQDGYAYVYADDVTLIDKSPYKGIVSADKTGFAVQVIGAPAITKAALRKVDESRAPKRSWKRDGAVRTLLASYDISITNPDGSEWQPGDAPVEVFLTLPEKPELSMRGNIYVEHVDDEGNVQTLVTTIYFLSNVISFWTDSFSEFFVYAVDYPLEPDTVLLEEGQSYYFSDLYHVYGDSSRPFSDVEDVSFSAPEKVTIRYIYNEVKRTGDWLITLLEPLYQTENFIIKYAGDTRGATRWEEVYGKLVSKLANNTKYFLTSDYSYTGNISLDGTTANICLGTLNGAGRALTLNGILSVGGGKTMNFTVNTGVTSNSHVYKHTSNNNQTIYVYGGANLYVYGGSGASQKVIFDGNSQYTLDPIMSITNNGANHVYLENCTFRFNFNESTTARPFDHGDNNSYPGGGISCGDTLHLGDNVTIRENKAERGAGLFLYGSAVVKPWDGKNGDADDNKPNIDNNHAVYGSKLGGGIYLSESSSYTAHLASVKGNDAAEGAGLYITSGTFNPKSAVVFNGNAASSKGGAIYISGGTVKATAKIECHSGSASWGAGIHIQGGTLYWEGSGYYWIHDNTAGSKGGGVYAYGGTIQCESGNQLNVFSNTANYGGGMYIGGSTDANSDKSRKYITFNGSGTGGLDIYSNTAKVNGGGMMFENCTVGLGTPADVHENKTTGTGDSGNGGGINVNGWVNYVELNVTKNLTVNNNTAVSKGAGIWSNCTINVTGGELKIINNTVGNDSTNGDGGGLYLQDNTSGGTQRCIFKTSVTTSISNNGAHEGGGIFLNGGIFETAGSSRPLVGQNHGRGTANCHHGGGIHAQSGTIRINSSQDLCVYENKGEWGPGVFFGQTGGTVTIDGTGAGRLWSHENHATGTTCSGVLIEACTVKLYNKWYIDRQVTGGTGTESNGGNGNSNGAITIQQFDSKAGTLEIHDKGVLEISACKGTDRSGGMSVYTNGFLKVKSGGTLNIHDCSNTGNGGGMFVNNGNIESDGTVLINNNSTSGSGGGIHSGTAPTFRIEGTGNQINGNTATGQGGGVWANNQAAVTISNCTMNGNIAKNGHAGGIIFYRSDGNAGALSLTGCTITNNICENKHNYGVTAGTDIDDDRGAGVYIEGISAEIKGCTISGNTTPYGKGGGIFFRSAGKSLSVDNCTIKNNEAHDTNATSATKAGHGGGIYVENASSVTVNNSTISGNKCDDRGGGICIDAATSFSIDGNSKAISGNIAGDLGGGIYTKVPLTITNALIGAEGDLNKAEGSHGGGIYADGVDVTLGENTKVQYNWTYNHGSGVFITKGGASAQPTLTLSDNAEINNNHAYSGGGGGVYLNDAKLSMSGESSIHGNHANTHGGGVYLSSGSISVSDTPQIHSNSAILNGGGIFSAVALTLSGGLLIGDDADETKGNTALYGNGGGIYGSAIVNLTDVTVSYNKAQGSSESGSGGGGGIYCKENVTLTTVVVSHNKTTGASSNGGGICVVAGKTVTINGASKVDYNTTNNNGGGVYINTGTITTENAGSVSFTGNYAGALGGALFIVSASVNLKNAWFEHNKAAHNGGGIYCKNTALALDSSNLFDGNMAGADTNGNAISGGSGNGGAIYFAEGSKTLSLTTVEMKNNKALRGADMTSGGHGGAISIGQSTLNLSGTMNIHDNYAGGNGGAINLDDTTLTVTGGTTTIQANEAGGNGGGVHMDAGCSINTASSTATHFTSNYAGNYGGGLYLNSATSATLTNAKFQTNAAGSDGGGIFCSGVNLTLDSTNTIDGNRAGTIKASDTVSNLGGRGGGIFFSGSGKTLTLNAVEIQNNVARRVEAKLNGHGGAVFVADCNLSMTGAVKIHDNTADCNGGGINLTNVTLTSTAVNSVSPQIYKNTAAQGGGILVENTAAQDWSSISMTIGGASGEGNNATLDGGGLYINGTTLTLTNSVIIQYNRAGRNGGGIYSSGSLTLNKTQTITYNYAGVTKAATKGETASATGGNGGGIYFDGSGKTLTLQNATIQDNYALSSGDTNGNGGGIYMTAGTTLKVTGNSNPTAAGVESSYIIGNTATNNGGGLYVAGGSEETAASKIDIATGIKTKVGGNNHEVDLMVGDDNAASGNHATNGGGIYLSGGYVTLTGAHELFVRQNTATADGGGMVLDGTNLTFEGIAAVVSSNKATGNGGGIALINSAKMKETSDQRFNIFNNTADGNGGGIWCAGEIETNGMRIGYMTATEKNYAPNRAVDGGGLYLAENGSFIATGNVYVANNVASGNGGGIYTKADLTVNSYLLVGYLANATNVQTECGNVAKNGGGIYVDGSTVTLDGAKVKYNRATANGGGIYLNGVSIITDGTIISNITDNHAGYDKDGNETGGMGGGIYVTKDAILTMNGGNITANYAHGRNEEKGGGLGGGIYVAAGATANLHSGTVSENHAVAKENASLTGMGGGVYTQGTVNFTGDFTISGNEATRYGGGFYQTNGDSATIINENVTVTIGGNEENNGGNKANNGGGMAFGTGEVAGTGTFTANGTLLVQYNEATTHGGGIYMANGSVTLKASSRIEGNTAGTSGGGICMDGAETMSVKLEGSSTITGNTAGGNGGGIWMNNGTATLTGAIVEENTARNGAGIYCIEKGKLTLEGTTIQNNTATGNGGGVCVMGGSFSSTGTLTVKNNTATQSENSDSDGCGGGIYVNGATKFEITGSNNEISSNTTERHGGGVCVYDCNATIENCKVDGNKAKTGHAGGVFIKGKAGVGCSMSLTNCDITNNRCLNENEKTADTDRGAGVFAEVANLTISGGSISYNQTVYGRGGGIYFSDKDKFLSISDCTIEGNEALHTTDPESTTAGFGGGISVNSAAGVTLSNITIKNNIADGNGGGIFAQLATKVEITGSNVISGNTALKHGGGVSVYDCDAEIANCVIDNNTAKNGHAGGVFIKDNAGVGCSMSLTNCDITNNRCLNENEKTDDTDRGAGVFAEVANLTISGGSISYNQTVYGKGGGIYFNGKDKLLSLSDCTIEGNSALHTSKSDAVDVGLGGGIHANNAGSISLSNVTIRGNISESDGGGIYISNTALTLGEGITISGNHAGVTAVADDGTKTISATGGHGGGIHVHTGATLTMNGGTVSGNSANANGDKGGYGGGIYVVSDSSSVSITGGEIHKNEAKFGGGVHGSTAAVEISGGKIYGNKAIGNHGGGVYAKGGSLTITGGEIYQNEAAEFGGGVFAKNIAVTFSGNGLIYENTAGKKGGGICLDHSPDTAASLTVTGFEKAPIYGNTAGIKTGEKANWDSAAGNDIYASGNLTTVTIEATEDNGVAEYWFADYAKGDTNYPGQKTFPSSYVGADGSKHLGRYDANVTPVSFARRSIGGTSTEPGAEEASKAFLALTLGTAKYITLTLTKEISDGIGAVENTTFIFYIKSVDNADFTLPVAIHMDKGGKKGSLTIANLPLGFYDICEDESWSWRYDPSAAAYGEKQGQQSSATLLEAANGDSYLRIQATITNSTSHGVTFTNSLFERHWLTDAKYMPFLAPPAAASVASAEDDEEE